MGHVALKEFFIDNQDAYFEEYARTYTDMPMLVILDEHEGSYVNGRFVRAADFDNSLGEDNNPDWKTVVIDEKRVILLHRMVQLVSAGVKKVNGILYLRKAEEIPSLV